MLAVLGGLADVERDLIRTRTAEGRSRAKGQGKAHGPSPFRASIAKEKIVLVDSLQKQEGGTRAGGF